MEGILRPRHRMVIYFQICGLGSFGSMKKIIIFLLPPLPLASNVNVLIIIEKTRVGATSFSLVETKREERHKRRRRTIFLFALSFCSFLY